MILTDINTDLIDKVFNEASSQRHHIIKEIMAYTSDSINFHAEEKRGFPGNKEFVDSGYYKTMLKRYFFTGSYLCADKDILDTCSGLGWGTYIVSSYANHVTAFDIDPETVNFCKETWMASNISWITGDALDLSFIGSSKFDVALGMETIEHFTKEDGEKYISEVSNSLKANGLLIGTSSFPFSRSDADQLCSNNSKHLHIFTYDEINEILSRYFAEHIVINNWMFIAKK